VQAKKALDMLSPNRAAIVTWEERIAQARLACEAWKQEAEESKIKATIASQQRDEVNMGFFYASIKLKMSLILQALMQATSLNQELEKMKNDPYLVALNRQSDLKSFPMHVLQSLHARLKRDLDEINRVSDQHLLRID
jgi:E3 ubiquitin-protein ligase UNKL